MSKDEICTCKACKNTVFHCQICKFMGFLLPSSSWLLKLPIAVTKSYIFRWRSRFRRRRVCLSSLLPLLRHCFKMAISKAVVSRVRVLATTHILVGALLVVFGIADAVTQNIYDNHFYVGEGFFGFATGLWVSFHCGNVTYFSSSKPFCFLVVLLACVARRRENWREKKSKSQ